MRQKKEYRKIFVKIEYCFQLLKRRLFVDQWLQESTKLVFAMVNKTKNPNQMLLFENLASKDFSMEAYGLSGYEKYSSALDDYLRLKKTRKQKHKAYAEEF